MSDKSIALILKTAAIATMWILCVMAVCYALSITKSQDCLWGLTAPLLVHIFEIIVDDLFKQ